MKKFLMMLVLTGLLAGAGLLAAQEFNPDLDLLYSGPNYHAYLKFNINDDLEAVYFSTTGEKWLEYQVVSAEYAGEDKGWVYKIKDGMGNQYVMKRASLGSDIVLTPPAGKAVTLKKKALQ